MCQSLNSNGESFHRNGESHPPGFVGKGGPGSDTCTITYAPHSLRLTHFGLWSDAFASQSASNLNLHESVSVAW